MNEVIGSELLDQIYRYGVVPVLAVAVYVLWGKTNKHEASIERLHGEQKTDIRNHAEEVKSLQQNTLNTINKLTDKLNAK